MLEVRMAGETDLANDPHALGLGGDACERDALAGGVELDAVEPLVEIELPPGAAELAVGRELEADLLLLADRLLDLAVLDFLQLRGGDLAALMPGARFLERCRAQQRADVIGAEGRPGPVHREAPLTYPTPRRKAR